MVAISGVTKASREAEEAKEADDVGGNVGFRSSIPRGSEVRRQELMTAFAPCFLLFPRKLTPIARLSAREVAMVGCFVSLRRCILLPLRRRRVPEPGEVIAMVQNAPLGTTSNGEEYIVYADAGQVPCGDQSFGATLQAFHAPMRTDPSTMSCLGTASGNLGPPPPIG